MSSQVAAAPLDTLRIVVADPNLLPHRALFAANLPAGAAVSWHDRFDETSLVADLDDLQDRADSAELGMQECLVPEGRGCPAA